MGREARLVHPVQINTSKHVGKNWGISQSWRPFFCRAVLLILMNGITARTEKAANATIRPAQKIGSAWTYSCKRWNHLADLWRASKLADLTRYLTNPLQTCSNAIDFWFFLPSFSTIFLPPASAIYKRYSFAQYFSSDTVVSDWHKHSRMEKEHAKQIWIIII